MKPEQVEEELKKIDSDISLSPNPNRE